MNNAPDYKDELIVALSNEIGNLKVDNIYKEILIKDLIQQNQALTQALADIQTQKEALEEVELYEMDDIIDQCFVAE